jgi:hypothetical protein
MGVMLMATMGALLATGLVLTLRWNATPYRPWAFPAGAPGESVREAGAGEDREERPSARAVALRYLRGVGVALVGGFWAGLLVTGPAIRLIMRLLAVTGGDDAQGRITEADEVVGRIDVGGTIGLVIFGGILPGLLSGAVYLVCRRFLPGGRLTGVAFGLLHLVVLATRLDPLRPDNPDFDIVGPGWLSASTFALAAVAHGMAVVAIANRYSQELPPAEGARAGVWTVAPLVVAGLFLALLVPVVAALAVVLGAVVLLSRVPAVVRLARGPGLAMAGRAALVVVALVLLPGAVADLHDVVVRDDDNTTAIGG